MARTMWARVWEADKADSAPRTFGIEMRCAFAHEIGRPEKTFGSSRNACGFLREAIVGIAAVVFARAELIAEPAERKPGGLRNAHDVPAAGNCVAESVETALRVERGAIRCGENDAGSTDGCADDSCADNAHSHGASGLVACAGNDRRAERQAGSLGAFLGKLAADIGRFVEHGQPFLRNFCAAQNFRGPAAIR